VTGLVAYFVARSLVTPRLRPRVMTPLRGLSTVPSHYFLRPQPRSALIYRSPQLQNHLKYPCILGWSTTESCLQARCNSTTSLRGEGSIMDAKTKQQYLADSPPTVVRLEIKTHFDALKEEKLKRYAHFMSRSVCPLHRISRT
jgi:hypothetical protein